MLLARSSFSIISSFVRQKDFAVGVSESRSALFAVFQIFAALPDLSHHRTVQIDGHHRIIFVWPRTGMSAPGGSSFFCVPPPRTDLTRCCTPACSILVC
jgi:hypothetical protein